MVRTGPSRADREVIAVAAARGVSISPTQLEAWRGQPDPLLPAHPRSYPAGPGAGSSSRTEPDTVELAVWLGRHAKSGGRRLDLALRAFGEDLPVPLGTVRRAFVQSVLPAAVRATQEEQEDASDSARAAAAADRMAERARSSSVHALLRRLEARVLQLPGARARLGAMQVEGRDGQEAPYGPRNVALAAGGVLLGGVDETCNVELGLAAQYFLPAAVPSVVAQELQFSDHDALAPLRGPAEHRLPGLPVDGVVHVICSVVLQADRERLAEAWRAAALLRSWAAGLCADVEAEAAEGHAGRAVDDWVRGAVAGIPGVMLALGLGTGTSPSEQAATGANLLTLAESIREPLANAEPEARTFLWSSLPPALAGLV